MNKTSSIHHNKILSFRERRRYCKANGRGFERKSAVIKFIGFFDRTLILYNDRKQINFPQN
ncbi:hypothetical protein CF65_01829 [Aggregatibacter actinomycetemcomitans HK1651]|nr:hypothetical protein CF65_01829 [Aggregatibacter actinomycetemcomitans HK1651]